MIRAPQEWLMQMLTTIDWEIFVVNKFLLVPYDDEN